MTLSLSPAQLGVGVLAVALVAGGLGYGVAQLNRADPAAAPVAAQARKILYWYDPMVPMERYPGPGKSSMNMDLIPKYADEAQGAAGVKIDPAAVQNLGVRLALVQRGDFAQGVDATGVLEFNQRDVAILQAKAAGFVQRVHARAPGDIVASGAPIADLLIPSWVGAQGEYLAVRRSGDPALEAAARQRLRLLGMPDGLIDEVARTGRTRNVVTVTAPIGGAIQTLDVRPGMTVSQGQTLAQVFGLSSVWLNAAVPEALAGQVRVGQAVGADLAAFPSETFTGKVSAILPTAQAESRTLTVRIELANRGGRLKPGMFASVHLGGETRSALSVPSEAVIRTGKRALVMIAGEGGRFQPVEVQLGREAGDRTEILAGLSEGQKVVASGQFLIDSEASLAGLQAKPLAATPQAAAAVKTLESRGRVEAVTAGSITLSHEPVPAIGWPAMTMTFKLDPPTLAKGLKVGDRVAFSFDQHTDGPVVRRLAKEAAR
ncbi:efflux RND transporter periplasmic adaptor subunit [Phenylobacterium sp. 58.2.17]|uniref:efflux RND transporter periplasmic adaptor subunit n=1 Tax=Phenylobacterium sp. 58.2.17 TaxID=2969306 RepID=UPI002264B752|nr:efflux RND transporter periplasmic adaptor subunit [Phenylobacterium sp. 58.2.17]MCX7587796.1 efflux RND transporter periplasmic adaptor subunit [Phenylobacterium sp. 58.2.17]